MIGLPVLSLAAKRASAAGVVLDEITKGAEPDPIFALEVAEKQLRSAFFSVRQELLSRRRRGKLAA